jgi:hypothetical protein
VKEMPYVLLRWAHVSQWLSIDGQAGAAQRRADRILRSSVIAGLALSTVATTDVAFAQDETTKALGERSAIVVQGKVIKTNASDEPMVVASNRTAVILIQRMYAGSEIAGDQTGRNATIILSQPERLKTGDEAFFFGNPRFIGRSLTIADEGEIFAKAATGPLALTSVEHGVQARRDKPVLDRLSVASLVFRGTVEAVRPLDSGAGATTPPPVRPSEHEPEWQVATVRVVTPLRGGQAGQIVTVIFPSSRDIAWFNAPKLKPNQDAIFIAHAPNKEDAALYSGSTLATFLDKQPGYLVTHPFDVLPPTDEARVRTLLAKKP